METNMLDTNVGGDGLKISSEIREYLRETAKWGKFLAIAGFVGIGLMVLIMLGMIFFIGSSNEFASTLGIAELAGGGFIFGFYIVIFAIYIFPLLFLYRFSTKIKTALAHDDQEFLSEAFKNLKSLYKFMGIFMAVILGLYALIFLFSILGGAASMMF